MDNPELIFRYFPDLDEKQRDQINRLGALYTAWNEKINVVSRKDIDQLYLRHVLHSLAIAKFISFKSGADVLDVGTGGGFPGIPLAILFPGVNFHLVDSVGKKIRVVTEIVTALGLNNVTAEHARAESLQTKYNYIVSRAVTQMPAFVRWTKGKFKKAQNHEPAPGIIYLKGGDLTEELAQLKQPVCLIDIADYFEEDFFETKKIVYTSGQ